MASRKAERCKQAMIHIRLAVQAMEDCPELPLVRDDLRVIYRKLQDARRADAA